MSTAHPVGTVVATALAVRLTLAVVSFLVNHSHLIGDEIQYVQLADAVASGKGAESWVPNYGQSLYSSTWAYCAPLAFLFRIFGTSRLWGQLLSVAAGTLAAGLTARLALEFVRPRLALLAGLVVALLPSQVMWSSVALRESAVWAAIVLAAYGLVVMAHCTRRDLVLGAALVAVGLYGLGHLRQQTLIAVAWAIVLAAPFVAGRQRLLRTGAAVALAVAVPAIVGIGLGGWTLVQRSAPSLGATRTYMALDAQSAFTSTTLLSPATTAPGAPTTAGSGTSGRSTTTTTTVPSAGGALGIGSRKPGRVLDAGGGEIYSIDESLDGNARSLLPGLVAVGLRPFPWEWGTSLDVRLAAMEDLAWYGLYVAAAAGTVLGWRRRRAFVLPAFLIIGNILGIGALTQGNLGTAFRHRGQLVWALAVLGAVAIEELLARRRDDGAVEPDERSVLVHA